MNQLGFFFKQLNNDFHRIRDFFLIIQENLLANDLRHKETCRLIGKRIFLEIGRRLRHQIFYPTFHVIYIKIRKGGDRNDLSFRKKFFPLGYQLFQFWLGGRIDLVNQ